MAWDLWLFEHIGAWDYLIRVVVACLCGGLIGLERTKRLKEAGIRTHIIVALGATLIMVVSKYGFGDVADADASRIASNVITGIILFCIIASEFFINYRLVIRKKKGADSK